MATGATGGGSGGGYGLATWIAGGAVVAGIVVGGMYYAGLIGPTAREVPDEVAVATPEETQPDTTSTPDSTPNVDDGVQPDATAKATPPPADDVPQDDTPVVKTEPAQPEPTLMAPGFDVVRVDPDGNAVIAGTGPAGAQITIFLDGEQQVSTTVDRSGAFVSLLSIAPSQTARILSMTAELDGQTRPSDDQIILAPSPVIAPKPVEDVQITAVEDTGEDSGDNTGNNSVATAQSTTPKNPVPDTDLTPSDKAEPDPASASDKLVNVADVEPAQPTANNEVAEVTTQATVKTPETASVPPVELAEAAPEPTESVESGPAQTDPGPTDPDQTELAQSDPEDNAQNVAAQADQPASKPATVVATSDTVDADTPKPQTVETDATASVVASEEPTPSQPVVTNPQSSEPSQQTDQSQQIAAASSGNSAEAAPKDHPPTATPLDAEPAQPDTTDTVVAALDTPAVSQPAVPLTTEPNFTADTPSDAVAKTDPANKPETEPSSQAIETAALADPTGETSVQPPAPQQQVTTAVPKLAPTPAQPVAPGQPQSPALITILRAGPDGVEVLQSGASKPQTQDKIALDVISYSEAGEIQLSGRAQVRSVVRVYLDNKPVGDLMTDDTGRWSGEVKDITPGIYTLRLDELGQTGVVLSRIETPFKRESPDVLRPPQDPNLVATGNTADGGPVPLIRAVTVQQGDTLWAISRDRYGDGVLYVRVFEANRGDIRDPDLIYPGQVFALPE